MPSEYKFKKGGNKFELKKKIGLWSSVAILCGSIVGSGIFVSPVGVLAATNGSVGLSLIMWIACGLLSLMSGLCYAELGCCVRESGADFAYNNAAIGPASAFVYVWTITLLIRPLAHAAGSMIFGTYILKPFFPNCDPPSVAVKLLGAFLIILSTSINYKNVKSGAKVQIFLTVAKYVALLIIIGSGIVSLAGGNPIALDNFENAFDRKVLNELNPQDVVLGFYKGLFAYNGFAHVNSLTEELTDIKKNLPRSIIISLTIVTSFYLLTNVAYFSVLTLDEILSSEAVAVTFGEKVLGSFHWVIPIGVSFSIAGSLNGGILVTPRFPFVAARRGHMPKILSMIHVKLHTPSPALILVAASALIMLLPADFNSLLNAFGFSTWFFYGLCALDLIILRRTRPHLDRPYKVPIVIPILVVIASTYLVIAPLLNIKNLMILFAGTFILSGFLVYYIFVHKKIHFPGLGSATRFLQKLLEVAPTDWEKIDW